MHSSHPVALPVWCKQLRLLRFASIFWMNSGIIMPTSCCVPLCANKGGHAFPLKDEARTKLWLIATRRDDFKPTKYSVVCYSHFSEDDYCKIFWYVRLPVSLVYDH